jgi:hypothetical protein
VNPLVLKFLRIALLILGATLLTALTLAQPTTQRIPCQPVASNPGRPPTPCSTRHRTTKRPTETSISLGAFPQLTATRIVTSPNAFTTESLSPSAGVLGTVRQSFSPWLGYSVNMGYTRATEHATDNAGFPLSNNSSNLTLPANVYELSLSYLAEKHLTSRLSTFADVGAGMLAFLPEHRGSPATDLALYGVFSPPVNYRPLGVAAFGIDYCLTPSLSLRAEYRGQLYKFADYGNALPRYLTLTSEPTLSLVYNFTRAKK